VAARVTPFVDVVIEALSAAHARVVAPFADGEEMLLQVTFEDGSTIDYRTQIVASVAVVTGGLARFRLELRLESPAGAPAAGHPTAAPFRALLMRRYDVIAHDFDRAGCIVEGRVFMPVGTVGLLSAQSEGQQRVEMFRVARTMSRGPGSATAACAVEFLSVPGGARSLAAEVIGFTAS
jgi:hypothetical protein